MKEWFCSHLRSEGMILLSVKEWWNDIAPSKGVEEWYWSKYRSEGMILLPVKEWWNDIAPSKGVKEWYCHSPRNKWSGPTIFSTSVPLKLKYIFLLYTIHPVCILYTKSTLITLRANYFCVMRLIWRLNTPCRLN